MRTEPLERELADPGALERTDERFHGAGVALQTVAQHADAELVPADIREALARRRPGLTAGTGVAATRRKP